MGDVQESAQRKAARTKMREAIEQYEHRRVDHAVELMEEALELDPSFIEPRKWLADHYAATGDHHLAVSQYESMLRQEPDNEELWAGFREVDAGAADRLYRLQHVAPDPFLGRATDTSDLDDFEDEDEEFAEDSAAVAGPAATTATTAGSAIFLDEDEDEIEAAVVESLPWDHEQDAEMRERLGQIPAFNDVLDGFQLLWDDGSTWRRLLRDAIPSFDAGWRELDGVMATAAGVLKAPVPITLTIEGHSACPLALPLHEPTLLLGKHLREALNPHELLFVLGWHLHMFMNQNAEFAWAADHIIERHKEQVGLHDQIVEAAGDFTVGWDQGVPREEVVRIAKLCHAWEQRAVLSADRAGLLCCEDPEGACRSIAVCVGDPLRDRTLSADKYLEQFKDVPAGQLAAISASHDPWTDRQYAAYRIQMLRWWATTDDYKRLIK